MYSPVPKPHCCAGASLSHQWSFQCFLSELQHMPWAKQNSTSTVCPPKSPVPGEDLFHDYCRVAVRMQVHANHAADSMHVYVMHGLSEQSMGRSWVLVLLWALHHLIAGPGHLQTSAFNSTS